MENVWNFRLHKSQRRDAAFSEKAKCLLIGQAQQGKIGFGFFRFRFATQTLLTVLLSNPKIMPNKTSFELTTPDNKTTIVKLKAPLRDTLSEYVEVYGTADDVGNIDCVNYSIFEPSLTQTFGLLMNRRLFYSIWILIVLKITLKIWICTMKL